MTVEADNLAAAMEGVPGAEKRQKSVQFFI